jgi:hypothetical protein
MKATSAKATTRPATARSCASAGRANAGAIVGVLRSEAACDELL